MENRSRQENLIYLVLWSLLFLAPLMAMYIRTDIDAGKVFDWGEVFMVWNKFGVFLLLFLIHNFLLAPLLFYKQRRVAYFLITAILLAGFMVCQTIHRPAPPGVRMPMKEHVERFDRKPPPPRTHREGGGAPTERDIMGGVMLMLMFAANLGAKQYYRSREDKKKLQQLEKQNIEQQLEYLKYQINPHFFMNTLNNIHTLVDIDPQKAQETILELSKMMRFILYEGDKSGVPLTKEFEFIRNYIRLMQLRYTDNVTITLDLPTDVPDKSIPPLMLISFIENAFKHGISYQHPSFIDIQARVSHDRLIFMCTNSKADTSNPEKGGVGLQNVKQRLNLLYDNNYTLNITDNTDTYNVEFIIPLIPHPSSPGLS